MKDISRGPVARSTAVVAVSVAIVILLSIVGSPTGAVNGAESASARGDDARAPLVTSGGPFLQGATDDVGTMGYAVFLTAGKAVTLTGSGFGTTPGTVWIGGSPFYASAAPLIQQTVSSTSWRDSAVTFTAVLTGLAHGDRRFVFVVDANGAASVGFPVYVQLTTPSISRVSSSADFATQGATLTIDGLNFGTRPDNYPEDARKLAYLWADFNATGGNLAVNPYRQLDGGMINPASMMVSSDRLRTTIPGDAFYRRVATGGGDLGNLETHPNRVSGLSFAQGFYYSQWLRRNVTFVPVPSLTPNSGQFKLWRFYSDATLGLRNYYPANRADTGFVWAEESTTPQVRNACAEMKSPPPPSQSNSWEYWEMYLKPSSSPSANDGELYIKVNNVVVFDWWQQYNVIDRLANKSYCSDLPGEFDSDGPVTPADLMVGVSWAHDLATGYLDSDDVYTDFTPARVVVGDAPTYNACTKFEVQLPITWTDSTITAQLNRGGFTDLSGRWLYVVDQYGVVNPNGFSIGTPTSTPTPSATPTLSPTLTVTATLTPTRVSSPTATPTSTRPIISENFDLPFTVVRGGTWADIGGRYDLLNPANAFPNGNISVANRAVLGNFTLTVDATLLGSTDGWGDFSILLGYRDPGDYDFVSFNQRNDDQTSGIFRYQNGVLTQLADITQPIAVSSAYAVEVDKVGSTITVLRDGVQLATATDPTLTGGRVGLGSRNDSVAFDNLVVSPR